MTTNVPPRRVSFAAFRTYALPIGASLTLAAILFVGGGLRLLQSPTD